MASIISAGTTSGTALNMAGDTSGQLQLATNGTTTAVTIDTSQNVGIGTTSPAQLLEAKKDQAGSTRIKVTNKTSSGSATAGLLFENSTSDVAQVQLWDSGSVGALAAYGLNMEGTGSGGVNLAANNASGVIRFATGGTTERMRIGASGSVGIGTTNTDSGSVSNGATIYAGRFSTVAGGGSISNGGTLDLFTIPTPSTFIVSLQTANASGLSAVAIMSRPEGGNPVSKASLLQDNANFTITFSGTTIRATNSLGGPIVCQWYALRLL
jgi:hypothetical protein